MSDNIEIKQVHRVRTLAVKTGRVLPDTRVVIYFPNTEALYLSVGHEDPVWKETSDSTMTNSLTLITEEGFAKTFRMSKDGSGRYFTKGTAPYVSMLVPTNEPRESIESLLADILDGAKRADAKRVLEKKETLLLEKLQKVQEELRDFDQ